MQLADLPEALPARLGRYTLERLTGRGGAGVVYRAALVGPAGFRKRLALKVIAGASSNEVVAEARLGAMLDHPNIVEIYDLSFEEPFWLIAMEWVDGPTLLEVLRANRSLPGRAVQQLGVQLAEALTHAHELRVDGHRHPIVHRDLKPSNVLVTHGGLVKLADLGLAAIEGTASELPIGTPGYMAPEQLALGGTVDPRTDQFALGIVLAETALGRRLVRGRTHSDLRARHQRLAAEIERGTLQQALDRVAAGLGAIVARCLSLDPDARFEQCAVLRDALLCMDVEGEELRDVLPKEQGTSDPSTVDENAATSLTAGPSNIPPSEEVPLGRSVEEQRLADAVRQGHLVIVHGPGGIGKSHLVQHYGRTLGRRFSGGTWRCDCVAVNDAGALCTTVSDALGLPLGSGNTPEVVEQVGHQLRMLGDAVVILDDADGAFDALVAVLPVWRRLAERARFVVTSRRRLRLADEQVVELGPLSSADAVEILRQRARRAGPPAAPWWVPESMPTLRALAEQLDGFPLSLELAAARAAILTPAQALERLSDRFDLLRRADGRHGTLEGVLRESWQTLSGPEQRTLSQLSVFRGGFSLQAAEGVVSREQSDPWVIDLVASLHDRSLVRVRSEGSLGPRFQLYESIRLYAAEQLDEPDAVALRHARWFARFGRTDASGTSEIDDAAVLDLDNLVAGLQTAIRLAEPEAAAGCAVAAGRRLHQRGPQRRGLDLAMRALQVAPEHSGLLAMAARLAIGQGEPLARTWAEHARANARDPRERAMASLVLGEVQMSDAAYGEATTTLTRALQEARQLGDTVTEAHAALSLGGLQILTHDERARGNLGFALHLARRVGHRSVHIGALVGLGRLETVRGDLDGARRWIEQSLELASGHPIERARAHAVLGATLSSQGDGGLARQHLHSALEIFRQLGMRRSELPVLANLAIVAAAEGNLVEACARQEEGLVLAGDLGDPMQVSSHSINLGFTLHRGGQLQRSRELFEQVRSDHLDSDLPDLLGFANLHLALHEVEVGQLQAALQRCEANTEHVFALGSHGSLLQAATAAALAHILNDLGRHEAALAAAERSLSVSTGDPVARSMGLVERGVSLERLGRDGGEEALQMARQSVGESDDNTRLP